MEAVPEILFRMNRRLAIIHLAAGVAWLGIAGAPGQVQTMFDIEPF